MESIFTPKDGTAKAWITSAPVMITSRKLWKETMLSITGDAAGCRLSSHDAGCAASATPAPAARPKKTIVNRINRLNTCIVVIAPSTRKIGRQRPAEPTPQLGFTASANERGFGV